MDENNNTPTPEELKEEQEALAEVKDDELRSSVASSLGLEDNDDNKELIDKLVEREKDSRTKLSKAIGQKRTWREKATGTQPKPQDQKPNDNKSLDADAVRKQAEEAVSARFDEEFLEDSNYSDTVKAEIRKVAKLNGTSARTAAKDPYIKHLMEAEEATARAAEAGEGGTRKGREGKAITADTVLDPNDYDLSTEDGRKQWNEDKAALRKAKAGK